MFSLAVFGEKQCFVSRKRSISCSIQGEKSKRGEEGEKEKRKERERGMTDSRAEGRRKGRAEEELIREGGRK